MQSLSIKYMQPVGICRRRLAMSVGDLHKDEWYLWD